MSIRPDADRPFVLHNIGRGTQEEDRLFEFKLTGHFRVPAPEPSARPASTPR